MVNWNFKSLFTKYHQIIILFFVKSKTITNRTMETFLIAITIIIKKMINKKLSSLLKQNKRKNFQLYIINLRVVDKMLTLPLKIYLFREIIAKFRL